MSVAYSFTLNAKQLSFFVRKTIQKDAITYPRRIRHARPKFAQNYYAA